MSKLKTMRVCKGFKFVTRKNGEKVKIVGGQGDASIVQVNSSQLIAFKDALEENTKVVPAPEIELEIEPELDLKPKTLAPKAPAPVPKSTTQTPSK